MTVTQKYDSFTYKSPRGDLDIVRPADVVGTINLGSMDASGNVLSAAAPGVDSNNSTAVALGGNAVFTGTATDVSRYTTVNVSVFADQASATNGLSMQQSSDGTNWDVTDVYTVPITSAGNGKPYRVQVAAKWFRVVYTNGATPQTAFRLQTVLKTADANNSIRMADAYSNENDVSQTQALPMVWDPVASVWNRSRASGTTKALTITRPANQTPYTAVDVVGGPLTFTNMAPWAGEILITSAALECDIAAVPAGMVNMRLYLYNVTPPSAIADNGAWDLAAGDRASYLGFIDLGTPVDLGSTLYVETNNINKQITAAGTSIFGYLVTIGGYTPAANSEVYVVTLHAAIL